MTVFVAFSGWHDDRRCVGVFHTREAAVSALQGDDQWRSDRAADVFADRRRGVTSEPSFDIEEHQVI